MAPIAIFPKRVEWLVLWVPVLLLIITVLDCFWQFSPGPRGVQIAHFLTGSLLLGTTHIGFQFAMLVKIPEFKQWINEISDGRPHRVYGQIVGVFVLAFFLVLVTYRVFSKDQYIVVGASILIFFTALHHGLAQSIGLTKMYNLKLIENLPPERRGELIRDMNIEKWLGHFLLAAVFVGGVIFHLRVYRLLPFQYYFLRYWAAALIAVAALCLVVLASKRTYRHTNKLFFSLRFLPYALPYFSYLAPLCWSASHGVEYWGVYENMTAQSEKQSGKTTGLAAWTVVFVIGLFVLLCFRGEDGLVSMLRPEPVSRYPMSLKIIAALSSATGITHYFLDRLIFRFRRPTNRRIVAPLLRNS